MNGEAARPPERGADSDAVLVFRPILIEADQFAGFGLMRCLGEGGLIARIRTQLASGTAIVAYFSETVSIAGVVAEAPAGWLEMVFDSKMDVSKTLRMLAHQSTQGRPHRALRLDIKADVEILLDDGSINAEISDISQRGLKLRAPSLEPGSNIMIRIPNLATLKAKVQWSKEGEAGLSFFTPLRFEELGQWCADRLSNEGLSDPQFAMMHVQRSEGLG